MKQSKRIFITGFLVLTAFVTAAVLSVGELPVRAADQTTQISDAQAEQVQRNCKQAQSTLQRLQTTDVATRINRGRIYENLLNRLIAPFNARVSLNRFDASSLTAASAQISKQFTNFKSDYQSYADSFAKLLTINCESDPHGFYSLLVDARTARQKVSDDITALDAGLSQYTDAFKTLSASVEESAS